MYLPMLFRGAGSIIQNDWVGYRKNNDTETQWARIDCITRPGIYWANYKNIIQGGSVMKIQSGIVQIV